MYRDLHRLGRYPPPAPVLERQGVGHPDVGLGRGLLWAGRARVRDADAGSITTVAVDPCHIQQRLLIRCIRAAR